MYRGYNQKWADSYKSPSRISILHPSAVHTLCTYVILFMCWARGVFFFFFAPRHVMEKWACIHTHTHSTNSRVIRVHTLLLLGCCGYIMSIRSARKNFFHLLVGVAFTPFMTAQFFTRVYYYDHRRAPHILFIHCGGCGALCVFSRRFFYPAADANRLPTATHPLAMELFRLDNLLQCIHTHGTLAQNSPLGVLAIIDCCVQFLDNHQSFLFTFLSLC